MSRICKFRAWDKKNKRMVNVWAIHWKAWDGEDGGINFVQVEYDDGTYDLMEHEVELIQSTGLHDKHGKEFSQGDIFKRSVEENPEIEFIDPNIHISEVRYYYKDLFSWPEEYEIIGNIHENPELLEQKRTN